MTAMTDLDKQVLCDLAGSRREHPTLTYLVHQGVMRWWAFKDAGTTEQDVIDTLNSLRDRGLVTCTQRWSARLNAPSDAWAVTDTGVQAALATGWTPRTPTLA